ncbi:MAG: Xaa-Pro peptidase family protein [Candidatus Omnitrophota bacterium]
MRARAAERNALLGHIGRKVSSSKLDALLVSDGKDVQYLTGFFSHGAEILITKKGRAFYFIDSMNETLARKELEGVNIEGIISGSVFHAIKEFMRDKKIKRIGVNEKNLSVREYNLLKSCRKGLQTVDASGMLPDMRESKKDFEIQILRRAAKETTRIWRDLRKNIETGMSEKGVATMIDTCLRSRGHENAFPTIAAAGKNTAYPHAIPSSKRLGTGEHLLVDFGIRFNGPNGYCSDLTRTWPNGRINPQIRDFRRYVRESHDLAIKRIKPGLSIDALSKGINIYFNNNKVGRYVLHGLGHGIGLDIHEAPFLREGCAGRLRKGMVLTVEPGLYKTGLGGVREEDMVLVTATGCEVLTA